MSPESHFSSLFRPLPSPFSNLIFLEEIDSTNDHAKRLVSSNQAGEGTVVLANRQLKGRGRLGRSWQSPPDVGLWVSLVLKPQKPVSEWYLFTFFSAVTVAEAIEELTHLPVGLKWPNDVIIRGKKCCGILLESVTKGTELFLIVGVGINVNQKEFPPDIGDRATSLRIEVNMDVSRIELFEKWLRLFAENLDKVNASVLAKWKERVDHWGKPVIVIENGQNLEGVAVDVGEDGSLILDVNGEYRRIYAGDVSLREKPDQR